jgi:hypothetical protein
MRRKPNSFIHRNRLSDASVTRALNAAAQDAVEAHRRAGIPTVDWQDGRVVLVPAEEIGVRRKPKKSRVRKARRK